MKKITGIAIILMLLAIGAIGCNSSAANTPSASTTVAKSTAKQTIQVSGSCSIIENIQTKIEGNTTVAEGTARYEFTSGDMLGSSEVKVRRVFDDSAKKFVEIYEEGVFTGTIKGKEGTFNYLGPGYADGPQPSDAITNGGWGIRYEFVSGTGDLADISGFIQANMIPSLGKGSYTGDISFGE